MHESPGAQHALPQTWPAAQHELSMHESPLAQQEPPQRAVGQLAPVVLPNPPLVFPAVLPAVFPAALPPPPELPQATTAKARPPSKSPNLMSKPLSRVVARKQSTRACGAQ